MPFADYFTKKTNPLQVEALTQTTELSVRTVRKGDGPLSSPLVFVPHEDRVVCAVEGGFAIRSWEEVVPLLTNPTVDKVTAGAKDIYQRLFAMGTTLQGFLYDVEVMHYLLAAHIPYHNPQFIARIALRWEPNPFTSWEACLTLGEVYRRFAKDLDERGLWELYKGIEMPLIEVLARMEYCGVCLDTEHFAQLTAGLRERAATAEAQVYAHAGKEFLIRSTKELSVVLYDTLGLPRGKRTKHGFSTDSHHLKTIRDKSPIIQALLDFRKLDKLTNTYTSKLPKLLKGGRLHCKFNQTVCATGRLSSSEPNLQNIPVRSDEGRATRRGFLPQEGWLLVAADYSQIELRVLAHYSGDDIMQRCFREGEDLHEGTARKLFDLKDGDTVTKDMRRLAKVVNFAIPYGTTPHGLALQVEKDVEFAQHVLYDPYMERFPKVRQYMTNTIALARRDGCVTTLLGRQRKMPHITSLSPARQAAAEREAINCPIQGTAADIMKLALIRIYRRIRDVSWTHMLMQVHDEVVLECHPDYVPELVAILKEEMVNAYTLRVPLETEVKVGPNWGEMTVV